MMLRLLLLIQLLSFKATSACVGTHSANFREEEVLTTFPTTQAVTSSAGTTTTGNTTTPNTSTSQTATTTVGKKMSTTQAPRSTTLPPATAPASTTAARTTTTATRTTTTAVRTTTIATRVCACTPHIPSFNPSLQCASAPMISVSTDANCNLVTNCNQGITIAFGGQSKTLCTLSGAVACNLGSGFYVFIAAGFAQVTSIGCACQAACGAPP